MFIGPLDSIVSFLKCLFKLFAHFMMEQIFLIVEILHVIWLSLFYIRIEKILFPSVSAFFFFFVLLVSFDEKCVTL